MTTTRLIHKDILDGILRENANYRKVQLPDKIRLNIDSRVLDHGDVFLALRGETHDGHNYIKDAQQKGAILIIADNSRRNTFPSQNTAPIIFVDDTLKTFSAIAALHLQKQKARKIAITGSNGKTTTKEMTKASLQQIFGADKVYSSFGNKNNHFGVPLSALEVTSDHDVAIFEMGMNHEGEIASLASIIEPDVGVITNISSAHSGNFKDGIDGVMRAKGELFLHIAKTNAWAVINLDDERVVHEAHRHNCRNIVGCGWSENADIRILNHEPYSLKTKKQDLALSLKNCEVIKVSIPLPGIHHAHNAAIALGAVFCLGLSVKDAAVGIFHMEKIYGRTDVIKTKQGFVVIDDGYNANPASMTAGILASLEIPAHRRIAVIGSMGELGHESKDHHFRLGQLLAQYFDQLFICGQESIDTTLGARDQGFDQSRIVYKSSSTELIEPLKNFLERGDVVFIKGSLLANMRAVVNALLIS